MDNAASTKEVILGTQNGQLFEMAVDEAEKREKYVKQLFELTDPKEPITGLQVLFALYLLTQITLRFNSFVIMIVLCCVARLDGNSFCWKLHQVLCDGCYCYPSLLFHWHRFFRS